MNKQLRSIPHISAYIWIALISLIFLQACEEKKTQSQQKASKNALPPAVHSTKPEEPQPVQHSLMDFVAYEDDGDYFQFMAMKGDSLLSLINSDVKERNLNRGDLIQVSWRKGSIRMAGDGDTEVPADLLVAVDKVRDGSVSKFRKSYPKKIKYHWAPEENYSDGYIDKIYLIVEYYLATTSNKLLKQMIHDQEQLSYSIEEQSRGSRAYTMIGIAGGKNQTSPVQWLYVDNENYQLYEYDLANDELKAYR